MADRGGSSFRQLVVILLLLGGARAGLRSRASAASLPGEVVELSALADSAASVAASEARRSAPLGPGERLDPNSASEEELDRLPGVGPSTAAAVVAARDTLPFASVSELVRVRGIGPGTLARLTPFLHVRPSRGRPARRTSAVRGAARRVPVNLADAQALQSLPGVGPATAERILELRARSGPFRRPADLLPVRGIGEATLERLLPFLDFRIR